MKGYASMFEHSAKLLALGPAISHFALTHMCNPLRISEEIFLDEEKRISF